MVTRVRYDPFAFDPIADLLNDSNLSFINARGTPRPNYRIGVSSDKSTLVHIVSATGGDNGRRLYATVGFNIYFAPISLASPNVVADPQRAYAVFQQSSLIGSSSAPPNGGEARIQDVLHAGLDGWFFATAFNRNRNESYFAGPLRNPIVGTQDSRVPPDIYDQTVVLADGGLDPWGRQLVEVTVSAKVPNQTQGISNIQVTNGGTGYTSVPVVSFTGGGGSGAQAAAKLNGDQVSEVDVILGGTGFTSTPTVVFTGGGGAGAAASAFLTTTGSFSGYQIYLGNYFGNGLLEEGPFVANGGTTPGSTLRSKFPLEQDTPPAHSVVLYFVALSQTGTRTSDPSTAPSVTFAGGIEP